MSFKIRFDANGGKLNDPEFLQSDDGYFSLPNEPERIGYKFLTWTKDILGNELFNISLDVPISQDLILYAQYELLTYTIEFLDNDWNTYEIKYVNHGDVIEGVTEPALKGHEFVGWYTDPSLTERFLPGNPVKQDGTIYPKFEPLKCLVWFDTGEDGPTVPTQTVEYGNHAEHPEIPEYYGHGFVGWFSDYTLQKPFDFSLPVTEELTIFAKFEQLYVTVEFVDEDGTEMCPSKTIPFGAVLAAPEEPVKEGLAFTGWKLNGANFTFTDAIERNITLIATFSIVTCNVFFELNGGISSEVSQKVNYGDVASAPETPEKEGHQFIAWTTDKELRDVFSFTIPIKEDITLYAKWKINVFDVHFMVDGEEFQLKTVDWNKMVNYASVGIPSKDGYNFIGWYDSQGDIFSFSKPIKENTFIYAKFDRQYTSVVLDPNGGKVSENTIKVPVNESIVEPNDPEREGYEFDGWYSDNALSIPFDFNTLITTPITLHARWEIIKYEVSINYNDNANHIETVNVDYGTILRQPQENPTLDGYTFLAWVGEDGETYNWSNPITHDTYIDATYTEYIGTEEDDFLSMINSDKYYDASDIDQAIKTFVASFVNENRTDGWESDDFAVVYNWAKSMTGFFKGDSAYQIGYNGTSVYYKERVLAYGVPLNVRQLTMIISALQGISPTTVAQDGTAESDSYFGRRILATEINAYLREIKKGNYSPVDKSLSLF